MDLTRPEGVDELVGRVRALGRPLACAALNAGVGVGGPFHETALEKNLEVVDLNCRSVVHLAHRIVNDMVERGEGRILISSVWETAADREASNAAVQARRNEIAQVVGTTDVKVNLYESVFTQVKQAALV